MHTFEFTRAESAAAAMKAASQAKTAQQGADIRFVAGGTTLIDLMKLNVETPSRLIDINRLTLDKIEDTPDGGLKIGGMARNSDLAHHPRVLRDYPVLSQAILSGASAQIRNMATTAGNLLQRTRCVYFRDTAMPCNKREPGTGCPAITGSNRMLAILGTSDHCIATNPSDMCVAMAALEATIHIQGVKGERSVPIGDFHLLPGTTPHRETVLEPGDLGAGPHPARTQGVDDFGDGVFGNRWSAEDQELVSHRGSAVDGEPSVCRGRRTTGKRGNRLGCHQLLLRGQLFGTGHRFRRGIGVRHRERRRRCVRIVLITHNLKYSRSRLVCDRLTGISVPLPSRIFRM